MAYAYLGTIRCADYSAMAQGGRVRSFPHVEGNYAVHVYIPGLCFCELVLLQMLLFCILLASIWLLGVVSRIRMPCQ